MQGTTASQQVAKELAKGCKTIGDIEDRLKELFKETLQQALEGEMDYHLGYDKHSAEGRNSGDSRNGHSKKTVRTRSGQTEVQIPRDRNAEFEPQIIRKYQTTDSDL
jgi:transposase-like protein